jgi:DnaJ domain
LDSNPYAVLGVARDATDAQITQARHQLVRKYHPDVNHDPDAAARFEDVQRAFALLSDPAVRAEYDRTHDEQGRVLVMRAADGGYGPGGEAAAGVVIEPTSIDFGVLTPQRPRADAKVTVAWAGLTWPGSITRNQGDDWWHVMGSASPASQCVVFHLRAVAYSGGPKGQQHAQFTVTVDDTVLAVKLSADFQGDFSAVAKPSFDPPAPRQTPRWVAAVNKHKALLAMAFLGLFGVAILVWAGAAAYRAYGERAQAGQFLAAPRCAGNATPAGDCSAWQTRTVSNVSISKGDAGIDLDGGALHLSYLRAPGWIGGLTAGESVPALVWEGSAQALRDPQGHVFYSENSALHQGDNDIATAACLSALALLSTVGAFAVSPWFRRRSPRYMLLAIVLVDVGVSGLIGGAVIQGANSVDTGVTMGVILFCVIGIAAAVAMRLGRARKLAARG